MSQNLLKRGAQEDLPGDYLSTYGYLSRSINPTGSVNAKVWSRSDISPPGTREVKIWAIPIYIPRAGIPVTGFRFHCGAGAISVTAPRFQLGLWRAHTTTFLPHSLESADWVTTAATWASLRADGTTKLQTTSGTYEVFRPFASTLLTPTRGLYYVVGRTELFYSGGGTPDATPRGPDLIGVDPTQNSCRPVEFVGNATEYFERGGLTLTGLQAAWTGSEFTNVASYTGVTTGVNDGDTGLGGTVGNWDEVGRSASPNDVTNDSCCWMVHLQRGDR